MVKSRGIIFKICVTAVGTVNLFLHTTAFQPTSNVVNTFQFKNKHELDSMTQANRAVNFGSTIRLSKAWNDDPRYHSSLQAFDGRNSFSRTGASLSSARLSQKLSKFVASTTDQFIRSCMVTASKIYGNIGSKIRKYVITFIFMLTMMASTAAFGAATSGGRVGGGSFKSRAPSYSRPSRSYAPRTQRNYYSDPRTLPLPRVSYYHQSSSPIVVHRFSGAPVMSPSTALAIKDVFLLTGMGTLIAYSITKNAYRTRGPDDTYGISAGGATIASVTVCIDVPNKNDPNSILRKLQKIASASNTVSNRGLKDLVTAVAIELTRREASIRSAAGKANFYNVVGQAEREFKVLSVQGQSKVDRLTFNKFESEDRPDDRMTNSGANTNNGPTQAIVTLNVGIQGNFVGKNPFKVCDRPQLLDLLTRIGSDVQLEANKLLSAEVLWSPEDPNEVLSKEEIFAKYPELLPM